MNRTLLTQIKSQLLELTRIVDQPYYSEKIQELKLGFSLLKVFLIKEFNTPEKKRLLDKRPYQQLARQSRTIYDIFYVYDEMETSLRRLQGISKKEFVSNNTSLAEKELQALQINKGSKLAYIGCGPYPWTAIKYAKKYGCQITCIDRDPEAVVVAATLVDLLGLSKIIKIVCVYSLNMDYSKYTHVISAAMAHKKRATIDHVLKQIRPGATIAFRSALKPYTFFYKEVPKRFIQHLRNVEVVRGNSNCELETFLSRQ